MNQLMGIGVDIESVSSFARARETYGFPFLKKAFSESEIRQAPSGSEDRHLASRFAVKEAVIKASGGRIFFDNVELMRESDGRPLARLVSTEHIGLPDGLKGCRCLVSLSHSGDNVVGMAVLVKDGI